MRRFLRNNGLSLALIKEAPPDKVPGPVRRGGFALLLYEHSLSITFFMLFIASITLHAIGGVGEYNDEQLDHGKAEILSAWRYLGTSSFWFESLQNWQSEFMALFAMVVLSIWLREKESPQSKEMADPHDKTGK